MNISMPGLPVHPNSQSLLKLISSELVMPSNHLILCHPLLLSQSHHFIANRWGNSGNSGWLYLLCSKITEDGDCSHEIKRCLLLGKKVMTNLDSILKSRDITLSTKVHLVKAMVFPVVMYGSESWTIKKAEPWRIDAFELWCWRRLLRVPLTARRSNQSILKEISPGCSLEGLMMKLKLQYFATWCKELTHWKRQWCWERLRAQTEGVTEDEMVRWHHQLNGHEFEQTLGDGKG